MDLDMDVENGYGHAAWASTWIYSMGMYHHGHANAAWTSTWTYSMNIDMQHGLKLAAWAWTYTMGMDMQHGHGHAARTGTCLVAFWFVCV